MATVPTLTELLRRWHELRRQGQALSPEDLCTGCPERLEELKRHLRADAAPSAATVAPSPGRPEAAPAGVAVPGYEVLGEMGRGGMGVVYRARQISLDRLVALKMVLAGAHAAEADRLRFRAEAEAVARLQPPNIVQVHEVGEAGGHPFLALELCPGGSLAAKLAGTPLPPAETVRLVEVLARAVQHAHEHGIVHRDLKPANVLLAADGAPKITDFGLAKKLDQAGQTQSGAILGTPSYMAPEQAAGKGKEAGPAADVYALGATLYECLTGRPPFKAATALDTVLLVLSEGPVPPGRLVPGLPRDLETVCLKCLHKEPARRYASAEALAGDLRRFAEGRPIVARPVGRLERAAKWVRRNPVLAAMAAVVVLALLGGTGVSTGFGIAARQQAKLAKKNETDAVARGQELATANETLTRTADDLQRSRNDLETTLARSLVRPLGVPGGDKLMTEPEWEALWELATNRRGRLGYRFVEEATRTPLTSRQLRDRAALALAVAVGLDEAQRAEVEALLMARLDDPALGDEQKSDLAVAASAWDGLSSPGAVRTARQFTRSRAETRNPDTLRLLAKGLSSLAVRLEAKDAATVTAQAATTLVQAMKDTKDHKALRQLAWALSALAARLEAKDAATITAQAAATLVAMDRPSYVGQVQSLAAALLSAVPSAGIRSRSATYASAVALPAGTGRPLAALALLIPATEPLPCRLSTQQLVELLKMPTCIGEGRRVILDQLGNRHRRTFADVWEFVHFAQEQDLGFDFTTPPQRPELAAPAR